MRTGVAFEAADEQRRRFEAITNDGNSTVRTGFSQLDQLRQFCRQTSVRLEI